MDGPAEVGGGSYRPRSVAGPGTVRHRHIEGSTHDGNVRFLQSQFRCRLDQGELQESWNADECRVCRHSIENHSR